MDTKELLLYLKICMDLEKNKYIQKQVYDKLNLQIKSCKKEYEILDNLNKNSIQMNPDGTADARMVERINSVENELRTGRLARMKELEIMVKMLASERNIIVNTHNNITNKTLKEFYAKDIIPEGYRELVPVCMFYDYISKGRTYSIRRNPNSCDPGAVNIYAEDCFNKLILNKLDIIIDKLNAIMNNQQVLFNAINDGNLRTQEMLNSINSNIAKLSNSVSSMGDNLQTIKYQNQEMIKCQQYSNHLQTIEFWRNM